MKDRYWRRTFAIAAAAALGGSLALGATLSNTARAASADSGYPAVTTDRLLNGAVDDGWLMYRKSYDARGYAPFDAINASNVAGLKVAFTYTSGLKQGHEGAPIVNGRYMFVTTPMDHVIALDATTGKKLWSYVPALSPVTLRTVCCDVVNRGVALYGNNVYLATLDNHVTALDAATGKVVWSKQMIPAGVGYAMSGAPLIVNGMVVGGIAGGEYGARCFIFALDAATGKQIWKTYSIPPPSEPGGDTWPKGAYKTGGGGTWLTGDYDPETKTIFWGVGNPGPWLADLRPGKNLHSDSTVALDAATGKIKWSVQYTPHDSWDYDGTNETIFADLTVNGQPVKAFLHPDRNGYLVAIDRTNGKFLWAKSYVKVTTITGYDAGGNAKIDPTKYPHLNKEVFTCPSFLGGKNWWPSAYDDATQTIYLPTTDWCMTIKGVKGSEYKAGAAYLDESFVVKADPDNTQGWGQVEALSVTDGSKKWGYYTQLPWNGPLLATKGGLVFGGGLDQKFYAFDSSSGKVLWTQKTSSGIIGVPTTYMVDGKQYVAVWAGYGGATPIWAGDAAKAAATVPTGGKLYVFALP